MHQLVVVCFTIGLSFLWRMIATKKMRDAIMPWTFAYVFLNMSCIAFMPGFLHTIIAITNYLATVILIDGFAAGDRHRNGSWTVFLLFWSYMILSCFWGSYALQGVFFWLNAFIISYASGYYFSRWVVNTEGGMRRTLYCFVCLACVMAVLYARHGGVSAVDASVQGGRATFNAETMYEDAPMNENYTALAMLCYIPVLLVALFQTVRTKKEKIIRLLSFVTLIFSALVLVRTGSRNGAVGLLPSLWYFLFSTTNKLQRRKRFLLIAFVSILFLPIVSYTMRGAEKFRIIDFSTKSDNVNASSESVLTSGRSEIWLMHIEEMSAVECLVGRGFREYNRTSSGRVSAGNAHSSIMTVFYNSGLIGLLLMLFFILHSIKLAFKFEDRGRIALLFIGTWFFSGAAESLPVQGGVAGVLAGLGMGLLCIRPKNSELMTERERLNAYGWLGYNWRRW